MNNKQVIGLVGAAAAVAALTVGSASAFESWSLAKTGANQSDARILLAQADAETEQPMPKVHYSNEQADRGEERYEDHCIECHGDDLRGGLLGGAPLRGVSFEEKYANGAPAGMLFEVMVATMPPNSPGRFSPDAYADMMAYILKRNGFQAGAELPSDADALYNLAMEK
ncbi:MAG TPA: cytochrome c [Devosia sp.]|jgi:mono/diheme cytochrome c family protein|nr:cytochrome c [Devosia sp.]